DNLKPINDEHGHEAGDRVLEGVATALRDALRPGDRVVRWGGDEFVVMRVDTDLEDTSALAERIRSTLASRQFEVAGASVRTSCSIGFALHPFVIGSPQVLDWEQVLHLADLALYRAKARRNEWLGWSGRRAAASMPDLAAVLAAQMDPEGEGDY